MMTSGAIGYMQWLWPTSRGAKCYPWNSRNRSKPLGFSLLVSHIDDQFWL